MTARMHFVTQEGNQTQRCHRSLNKTWSKYYIVFERRKRYQVIICACLRGADGLPGVSHSTLTSRQRVPIVKSGV